MYTNGGRTKMSVKISVIVPCYNEEAALPIFYEEITKVFNKIECSYELILVNDGSKDSTLASIKKFASCDDHVKYISFSRNFGKESAMYAGFCNAKGDYVAVMDADMQDPPSLLPKMLHILENSEYDSVATRREDRKGEPLIRSYFARKFYKIINRVSDADVVDGARDFRLMRREMVDAIVSMSEYNRFSKGIFGWVGFKTYWMPYENVERVAGETKWNFWKLFKYAISGIINFSQAPLDMVSYIGAFSTIGSLIALIVIIVKKLALGDPVQGWASMVCIVIFMSGLILFCLGIIGQYIAKIYMETKNRPHYIASESNIENVKRIK
ncbi:glycosyltransferase family 2 protein [uncultured Pseudoramibacter sp.]|uniref:glycosyltransferase family 2 protein n=1 Tax=uncultured Pseudoramibacter sp. TaxID=1623493 RepID=UPI0025E53C68|nr:glycosyltransferase family 2 protein [uncultured Pseudoramibacter sp.]